MFSWLWENPWLKIRMSERWQGVAEMDLHRKNRPHYVVKGVLDNGKYIERKQYR